MKETTYWKSRTLRDYYRKLTPSSDETAVDVLWTNSLRVHFPLEGYGTEAQTHPAKKSSKKCNIVVSSFQGQGLKRVLVIENKRRKFEGSSAVWTEAVQKVTDYLLLARAQQPDVPRYFAIVNVGLYSRFYKLAEKEPVLVPLEGEENPPLPFHYRKDRITIDRLLKEIASQTSPSEEEVEDDEDEDEDEEF